MDPVKALSTELLCRRCDPELFSFETTAELEDLREFIGQSRANEALQFGIGIQNDGYNLFVLGSPGVGKQTMVRQYLEQQAAIGEVPPDWCYVNNFEQHYKPSAIKLPSGKGEELRGDMERLVEDLRSAIPAAFEAEEYHARIKEIEEDLKGQIEAAFEVIAKKAEKQNISLLRAKRGYTFAPVKDNKVIEPDKYKKLPEEEKKNIEEKIETLQEDLDSVIHQQPQWQRETRVRVKDVEREAGLLVVGHFIEELKQKYQALPEVLSYFDAVQKNVIDNLGDFLGQDPVPGFIKIGMAEEQSFRRYQANVIIDHSASEGLPVIYEDSPLYQNLVGRVEYLSHMGALFTDYMLIKPGALHRANGGYLILDARTVLLQPYAWEGLKRALYSREIRIQSLGEMYSLVSTVSLEPEPIPLDIKVVLLGDRLLYYLLFAYDPDFGELFKVEADFEEHLPRNEENNQLYARLIATLSRKENLLPYDRGAVARVIEQSARLVGDAGKLTAHMLSVADLLRESDFMARQKKRDFVEDEDVQHAIDLQVRRSDRLRERVYEEIKCGTIIIDVDGEKTGQVNGLSVIALGKFAFAQPTRVTATARLGEGELLDIEREVELGGAIHSKGVLILSSFLSARYAKDRPLSLSASLVFEQSYGEIEGDSATVAELCALMSVLAEAPVRQSLAITGSADQHGNVQAIGGVNEKIEGFFDVCKEKGLNGEQGVVIPQSNVKHLMLRQDVVDAASEGQFHVYPINTVDQAIELLTGVQSGERDEKGLFPDGSINFRIEKRLLELAELRHQYAAEKAKNKL